MSDQERPKSRWGGFALGAARTAALLGVGTIGGYMLAWHHIFCAVAERQR